VHTPHHILITQMVPWGFIKSSMQTYIVHMKRCFRLGFPAQTQPRGLHGGHYRRIPSPDQRGLYPIVTQLNPVATTTTSYEYLFYLLSSDRLRPPAQRKSLGATIGSCTLGTAGHWLRCKNSDMTDYHQQQIAGEPYTPYWEWSHPPKENQT
jgi:hypothetical protein